MSNDVIYENKGDGVILITLNRPEKMNAWTTNLGMMLFDAYDRADSDPDARVVVVTGAGRAFCAGADMGGLANQSKGDQGAFTSQQRPETRLMTHPMKISKPVICAINGGCAGLGLAVACACDIRFGAAGAKITPAFSRRGLIAEHGLSWALPHLVGTGNAMLWLMTSNVATSEEAEKMGLLQRVFPKATLVEETIKFARDMAKNVPAASLAVIKKQVWHHPAMHPDSALRESNALMNTTTKNNPDFIEGVASFVEKRDPMFGPYDPSRPVVRLANGMFASRI